MKKAFEYYKGLPLYAQVAIGAGGIIIVYAAFSKAKNLLSGTRAKMLQESKQADAELRKLALKGIRPSFPDSQYQAFSNKIVAAANDCGTDEDAIYTVFKALKNEADLQKLIASFGIRKYKGCFSSYFGFEERSLGGLLTYELSDSEIKELNKILASKKINFSF
jgi:hypothetical protein